MKAKKIWNILKAGIEDFSIGMGAASIAFTVITVFTAVSAFISVPISFAVGIIAGVVGCYFVNRELNKKESKEAEQQQDRQENKETEEQILSITRNLEFELKDIKQDIIKHHADEAKSNILDFEPVNKSLQVDPNVNSTPAKNLLSHSSVTLFPRLDGNNESASTDSSVYKNDAVFSEIGQIDSLSKPK